MSVVARRLLVGATVLAVSALGPVRHCVAGENSLEKGAWALQFEIDRDFDLSSFQGSTLSAKKHISDGTALRLGIDLSYTSDNSEGSTDSWSRDQNNDRSSTLVESRKTDHNGQVVAVTLQKIFYPRRDKMVAAFFGFGPTIRFDHNKTSTHTTRVSSSTFPIFGGDTTIYATTTTVGSNSARNLSAGARGVIGVEWFPGRNISFLAEYGTGLVYSWGRSDTKDVSTRSDGTWSESKGRSNPKGISLQASAVKFGLSVYF